MRKRACTDRALSLPNTGMQWKCLPVPQDINGKPAIHYTTVYKVFAKWADDGSLWQAFVASVAHLSAEKHLDISVLHGDGTQDTVPSTPVGGALRTRGAPARAQHRGLGHPKLLRHGLPCPALVTPRPDLLLACHPSAPAVGSLPLRHGGG